MRILLVLTCLLMVGAYAQEPPPDAKFRLKEVKFDGLQAQKPEKMIVLSELRIGQTVDMAAVNAAAQRLAQTGLFEKVSYRYRYSTTEMELTFAVVEKMTGKRPVKFDNFVWFSDREIIEALRRDLPDFDGSALGSDVVGAEISKSLTRLLREKKIAGEVVYELDEALSFLFKVKGANLNICGFQFAGVTEDMRKPLLEALQPLLNAEYSVSDARGFAKAALVPVYTQHGYLKVAYQQPLGKLGTEGKCQNAVVVTFPFEEGLQYRWGKVAWAGIQAFTASQLDGALRQKTGEVANSWKIEGNWVDASRVYSSKGYLAAQLRPEPVFEDDSKTVNYRVAVSEGPQYRMGLLVIEGLPEERAAKLRKGWPLKEGDVLEGSVIGTYLARALQSMGVTQPNEMPQFSYKRNDQAQTADVVLKFEK